MLDVSDNLNIYMYVYTRIDVASNQHDLHHAVQVLHNNRLMDNQSALENEDSRSVRTKRKDFLSPMISSASLECDSMILQMIGHPDAVPQRVVHSQRGSLWPSIMPPRCRHV